MNFKVIFRIFGVLLMLFSLTHLPPMLVSFLYGNDTGPAFFSAFTITLSAGLLCWLPVYRNRSELRTRDGFLVVALFWVVLGTFGSIPFYLSQDLGLSVTDAVFESISGLTTTGATVITNLDELPRDILFYRQQLQWMGGMGIIAIAVAILPMLGIGGMQLYRAESPGPVKDNKLLPRFTETAKALLTIYLVLTLVCTLSYWAAGMTLFDAICHSFSTVAIGGFSTHDDSMAWFNSPLIESIAIVFMILAGINFALHFMAWRSRSLLNYLHDPEFKFYISLLIAVSAVTVLFLIAYGIYDTPEAVIKGTFQVVSLATTTGFASADFASWPTFIPFLMFYMAIIGGCAGSTAGGMKVIRVVLIIKQGLREIQRLIHPNAVIPVKLGTTRVPDRVVESVWGFFSVYVMAYMAMLLAILATGLDITTAFTAVGAAINNLGPGLGEVSASFASLSDPAKWILCLAMLLGRLEVFTVLVILSPQFWRR